MSPMTHLALDERNAGPQRTCVGCRQVDRQDLLLRVTAPGPEARLDRQRKAMGRGAYVHPTMACIAGAEKGGFSRSFRRPILRESIALIREHMTNVRSEGSNE